MGEIHITPLLEQLHSIAMTVEIVVADHPQVPVFALRLNIRDRHRETPLFVKSKFASSLRAWFSYPYPVPQSTCRITSSLRHYRTELEILLVICELVAEVHANLRFSGLASAKFMW